MRAFAYPDALRTHLHHVTYRITLPQTHARSEGAEQTGDVRVRQLLALALAQIGNVKRAIMVRAHAFRLMFSERRARFALCISEHRVRFA